MKVEIWSDVMCPFCYIGKRRFEKALEQFAGKEDIRVEWKSFQLNPGLVTDPHKNITDYLSQSKGWTPEYARQVNARVTDMAQEEGLDFDFDKAVVANSWDAHRIIQLAKTLGKGNEMEEQLFRAYFTTGQNIADHATLIEIGTETGIDPAALQSVLASNEFAGAVEKDIYEAQQIGVRGVPYFVFNDKYAVSGAQAAETFHGALNKAWSEWHEVKENNALEIQEGNACQPGGDCN